MQGGRSAAGWVATLAIVLMNLVSRQDLLEAEEHYTGDDGAAVSCASAADDFYAEQLG